MLPQLPEREPRNAPAAAKRSLRAGVLSGVGDEEAVARLPRGARGRREAVRHASRRHLLLLRELCRVRRSGKCSLCEEVIVKFIYY